MPTEQNVPQGGAVNVLLYNSPSPTSLNPDVIQEEKLKPSTHEDQIKSPEEPKKRGRGRPRKQDAAKIHDQQRTQKVKRRSLGGGRALRNEHPSPGRLVPCPSKRGLGVDEGDAACLAPKVKQGRGRPKKYASSKTKNPGERAVTATKKRDWGRPRKEDAAAVSKNNEPAVKKARALHKKDGTVAPQNSLKPVLKVGSAVYAAYWPPNDQNRESEPSWYPGVVLSCKVSQTSDDDRYGHVRRYNVQFDDGDVLDNIPDNYIYAAEEYLLHLRHDNDNNHSWLGVKHVTDKTSKDAWAQQVGWYVANIDGEEHAFSFMSDALRAYDASVVRSKGIAATTKDDLNLPEDWERLIMSTRGRGRPRKDGSPAIQLSLKMTTKKRGPGRPRKVDAVAVSNKNEPTVKRGRGRPRKDNGNSVAVSTNDNTTVKTGIIKEGSVVQSIEGK